MKITFTVQRSFGAGVNLDFFTEAFPQNRGTRMAVRFLR